MPPDAERRRSSVLTTASARYTQPAIVFKLASSGDVALLSYNWLVKLAASGKPLARRQELPPEAFADVPALEAMHAALPPHIAAAVLPVVSVSYCWLSAAHPDSKGEQLRHIVKTLEKHAGKWREFFSDMGVFWDWGSIHQKDPALFDRKETPEAKRKAKRAAFVAELAAGRKAYGGSAYEASRSDAEKAAFKRALHDTMDVWYAHQMIVRERRPPAPRAALSPGLSPHARSSAFHVCT